MVGGGRGWPLARSVHPPGHTCPGVSRWLAPRHLGTPVQRCPGAWRWSPLGQKCRPLPKFSLRKATDTITEITDITDILLIHNIRYHWYEWWYHCYNWYGGEGSTRVLWGSRKSEKDLSDSAWYFTWCCRCSVKDNWKLCQNMVLSRPWRFHFGIFITGLIFTVDICDY